MNHGLSKTAKWSIVFLALLALAMGINGAASASRSSVVEVDHHIFANTLLLQDGINTISLLQTTATPADQASHTNQYGGQTAGTDTGANDNNIDLASLPNDYFNYFRYLDR